MSDYREQRKAALRYAHIVVPAYESNQFDAPKTYELAKALIATEADLAAANAPMLVDDTYEMPPRAAAEYYRDQARAAQARVAELEKDRDKAIDTGTHYYEDKNRLQAEINHMVEAQRGHVWYWQDDGEDYPTSLGCPVVVKPDVVRRWVAAESRLATAEADALRRAAEAIARRMDEHDNFGENAGLEAALQEIQTLNVAPNPNLIPKEGQ